MLKNIVGFINTACWSSYYKCYRKKYDISPSFKFNGEGTNLYGDGKIVLAANSYIGRFSSIQSSRGCTVKVGENCCISHFVMIYTENAVSDQNFSKTRITRKGDVRIGDYCWIGAHVFIREGVTIGNNVVVGANSVVTHDIPDYMVVAGCPAKVIKKINR